ncbi:ribonuclease H2 subunit C [Olea europaea subsp. europaea]|uniref:Ribonuclease H2 subunit C n=1 Tax=Olea europaea subsp. europaea TaxID=158383 RepID=A0A8S0T1A8_OLEEU|nr:ribonuclease H2 subunit C [Olea europaea subsp. europaea]
MDGGNEGYPLLRSQTTVDLSRNGEAVADLTGKVHLLPCCIKYDGSTSVSDYFKPKFSGIEVDGLRVEEAYFRGRKLNGATLPLPDGYSGFILGKKSSDEKTNAETSYCWEANAKFQNLTLWNHDSLPSNDDAFMRTFHWFAVAKALHQPVNVEDLEYLPVDEDVV